MQVLFLLHEYKSWKLDEKMQVLFLLHEYKS